MVDMVAGIDYSMSSPCIAIHPRKPIKNFNDCIVFLYTKESKYGGSFNDNIHGIVAHPYEHEMERFHNISEWALAILNRYDVKDVCLEGYSMGSKGAVFNIGENTGILKWKMWRDGYNVITPAPTTVKKTFAGKGNAKKDAMVQAFDTRFDMNLAQVIGYKRKTIESPLSDIVDAVAMADYGITNSF